MVVPAPAVKVENLSQAALVGRKARVELIHRALVHLLKVIVIQAAAPVVNQVCGEETFSVKYRRFKKILMRH